MRTALATTALAAALGGAALLTAAPADAMVVDPGAYGVAATGPLTLGAQPSVDWTSGTAVSASSPGLSDGPLSIGPMAVAAGEGFAIAHLANLRYGDTLTVTSLTAACADGPTTLSIVGRIGEVPLRPGDRVPVPGGYAEIGATGTNPDGSVTVIGLTLAIGGERLLAAVARC